VRRQRAQVVRECPTNVALVEVVTAFLLLLLQARVLTFVLGNMLGGHRHGDLHMDNIGTVAHVGMAAVVLVVLPIVITGWFYTVMLTTQTFIVAKLEFDARALSGTSPRASTANVAQ